MLRNMKLTLANPFYYISKPSFKEVNYSNLSEILKSNRNYIKQIVLAANDPKYLYWDKFKHKSLPKSLSMEEQWLLVHMYRDASAIETPIKSVEGENFKWTRLVSFDERLHEIDMLVGGGLFPKSKIPVGDRETYVSRGVIEESIASSQLEGAHTTRAAAKKMILEKKKPKNKSEQMIQNNYQVMLALEDDFKGRELSREMLFELHSMLTENTLETHQQKRFRQDDDEIVVEGMIGSETYTTHVPPDEIILDKELDRLIAYANDSLDDKFTHPIIKAIFIHFWVGYLHPFVDGNGRLARALFYWYLLKKGYWTFSYIPISTVIKKSSTQYAMAYIYAEQDGDDITYFLDYQMRKVMQAMKEFSDFVERQAKQNQKVGQILNSKIALNDRQKQLVFYFISEDKASTTTTSHLILNEISRVTATKDLKELEKLKLIEAQKEGKYVRYYATDKLKSMVELDK
ncbi:MAG: hypothetical protein COY80_03295 [Candidatus Pacebacteria bacterium CG_4_10_14_0_8_um_filter_42_14]|nr:MAG: hypothetical protein COY80_03295 [Candidatus Pacebacteria bacterium CG_4_10_14_0_8_um_filter_42_14]